MEMEKEKEKKQFKISSLLKIGLVLLIALLVLIGLKPPSITIKDDGLKVGGLYGKLYKWDLIQDVTQLEEMPRIAARTNGMDLGSTLRGYFKVDDFGNSTLQINKNHTAFIVFKYENKSIFLSFSEASQADDLYKGILSHLSN